MRLIRRLHAHRDTAVAVVCALCMAFAVLVLPALTESTGPNPALVAGQ